MAVKVLALRLDSLWQFIIRFTQNASTGGELSVGIGG